MSKLSEKILEIVDKYEVPKEYHAALWDAFAEGTEEGFKRAVNSTITIPPITLSGNICKDRHSQYTEKIYRGL